MKPYFTLACYDIHAAKTRRRIVRILSEHGVRVQKSVFELHVDRAELTRLQHEIHALLNPATDSARYYLLCADCKALTVSLGETPLQAPRPYVLI
ncbi:MAG: CRISPR-associated endonuclease Cas2 [bacterium]|jgi:CRISPR-associated protein Cas2|nr:CRISPR-associated endonuclease Cas2 [bacterium]